MSLYYFIEKHFNWEEGAVKEIENNGVSVSTVIRYFDRITVQRSLHLPSILSLDEFRGNAHGQRYQVAVK